MLESFPYYYLLILWLMRIKTSGDNSFGGFSFKKSIPSFAVKYVVTNSGVSFLASFARIFY
jgi:hypothetical protein